MYDSPVELFDVVDYAKKVNEEIDNYIYEYIVKLGINVNKEELIKALQYDREQYEKGYKDGLKATDWHPITRWEKWAKSVDPENYKELICYRCGSCNDCILGGKDRVFSCKDDIAVKAYLLEDEDDE